MKKQAPEISIEWLDVKIDIKVCGMDVPPDDRGFVRLFPVLDPKLLSSQQLEGKKEFVKQISPNKAKPEDKRTDKNTIENPEKVTSNHVLPKLTCNHCGKVFSRRSTLEQHMAMHNDGPSNWEEVQDASLHYLEHSIVFNKLAAAGKIKNFGKNDEEEQEIPPPSDMRSQEKLKDANKTDDSGHKCVKCNKKFSKLSLLNRHMKLHLGVKPYQCNVCGWRFLQRYNLKKHMWTHSGIKPNKCGSCDASYTDSASLRNHVLKHHQQGTNSMGPNPLKPEGQSTETPGMPVKPHPYADDTFHPPPSKYKCPKCERVFAAKSHLDRHLPVHTTIVKPFSCDVCGWRFHLMHNMKRHMATHSKNGDQEKK